MDDRAYNKLVDDLIRDAANDFRKAESEVKLRQCLCSYLKRGRALSFSQSELIDFLGVSSPSVLSMAGYSEAQAQKAMEVLGTITDEEIQAAIVNRADNKSAHSDAEPSK
jgi:hypothetical protein